MVSSSIFLKLMIRQEDILPLRQEADLRSALEPLRLWLTKTPTI